MIEQLADDFKEDHLIDIDSNIHDTGIKSAFSEQEFFNPQDNEITIDVDKVEEETHPYDKHEKITAANLRKYIEDTKDGPVEDSQPNPFKEEIEDTQPYLRQFIVGT